MFACELAAMPYYVASKIMFIHIPKCAGTFLERVLETNDRQVLRSGFKQSLIPNSISLQHQFYSTLLKHNDRLGVDLLHDSVKTFAVVRNPYDRVASAILWPIRLGKSLVKDTKLHNTSVASRPLLTKERFQAILKGFINKTTKVAPYNDNHSEPQYKFVCDDEGNLYENVRVFKLETLHTEVEELNSFLNKRLRFPPRHSLDYSVYYNSESIRMVNEYYKKDFELFGYEAKEC